jgi:hypothetical protein
MATATTVFWGLSAFYLFFAAVTIARRDFAMPDGTRHPRTVQFLAALGYGAIWPVIALLDGPPAEE